MNTLARLIKISTREIVPYSSGIRMRARIVDIINENVRDVMYKYDLKEENDKKETKTTEKKK